MINKSRVAILSTVINFNLYRKSAILFPSGIRRFVIDGRNGMHGLTSLCYMMTKLKNKQIDWLIMADEDVIFLNTDSVFSLIEEMNKKQIMFCGVRDGGSINHRVGNPNVINTFFSVLNFKALEKIWNKKEMLANQFTIPNEFDDDLGNLPYNYDRESLAEPYYCFYLWLRRKSGKALFLNSSSLPGDEIANAVHDLDGEVMLYHTWYSRAYKVSDRHTKRIDAIFNGIPQSQSKFENPIMFKDRTYKLRNNLKRIYPKLLSMLTKLIN